MMGSAQEMPAASGAVVAAGLLGQAEPVMNSRDIAQLLGKRHAHVLRDVENMLAELGQTSAQFWGDLPDSYGRPQRVAFLPRHEVEVLVTGYDVRRRSAVLRRLAELEAARRDSGVPNLRDPASLQRLAVELVGLVQEQQARLDEQSPKAAAFDRLSASDGSMTLSAAAKSLGIAPSHLTDLLAARRWIFRSGSARRWQAYQNRINQRVLEERISQGPKPEGGQWVSSQVRVTSKGLAVLAKIIAETAQ
ncbi:MAG: phage regulatory protein/antirepressor Ant [Burkholderiaceae bacterium]